MIVDLKVEEALPSVMFAAESVTQLTSAIGTPNYVNAALEFARPMTGASFISLFCQGDRDQPLLVGTACLLSQRRAERAAKSYERHSDSDRNAAYLAGEAGNGDFLTVQHDNSISSFTYRRDCYEGPGISARISMVRRTPSFGIAISLYSSVEDGPFPTEVHDSAASVLRFLLTTSERHVAFSLRSNTWQENDVQTRLATSFPDLTHREREVAAMTVKGRTAAEIAEILGVAETTVITHRKRAYKRMKVSSLRELMATI